MKYRRIKEIFIQNNDEYNRNDNDDSLNEFIRKIAPYLIIGGKHL